jgi:hypothetical protein
MPNLNEEFTEDEWFKELVPWKTRVQADRGEKLTWRDLLLLYARSKVKP